MVEFTGRLTMGTIYLKKKKVYGKEWVCPACPGSDKFAKLLNKRTFSVADLEIIKDLGFSIEIALGE